MAKLMVFKEVHHVDKERYFVVNSEQDRAKAALKMLRERNTQLQLVKRDKDVEKIRDRNIDTAIHKAGGAGAKGFIELDREKCDQYPDRVETVKNKYRQDCNQKVEKILNRYEAEIEWNNSLRELLNAEPEDAVKMIWTTPKGREYNLALHLIDSSDDTFCRYIYEEIEDFDSSFCN